MCQPFHHGDAVHPSMLVRLESLSFRQELELVLLQLFILRQDHCRFLFDRRIKVRLERYTYTKSTLSDELRPFS